MFTKSLLIKLSASIVSAQTTYQVTTFAGSGFTGSYNGQGSTASFDNPSGVAVSADGTVYVADSSNNMIRKISSSGIVSTLAGSAANGYANGQGTSASFWYPSAVAIGSDGTVYVADTYNHLIRKISSSATVSTLAGSRTSGSNNGQGTSASFYYPSGIAADSNGVVYVADSFNGLIRKISLAGIVSTLQLNSNGQFTSWYYRPYGIAVDSNGNLYVADYYNSWIQKITTSSGFVSIFAGTGSTGAIDGQGTAASFNSPFGIAVDSYGNVYVADSYNQKIRKISPSGLVSTIAGSEYTGSESGIGAQASFYLPTGVAVDSNGNLYVADSNNNMIRKLTPTTTSLTASTTTFAYPTSTPIAYSFAGSGLSGSQDGDRKSARFYHPKGVAMDANGNAYIADFDNHAIRYISASSHLVSTLAGTESYGSTNGYATSASFNHPSDVVVEDGTGNLYIADSGNHMIRKYTASTSKVTTFAGSVYSGSFDGVGVLASFYYPQSLAISSQAIYVADTYNHKIRVISLTGNVSTLAGGYCSKSDGQGSAAGFCNPSGIAIGIDGSLYVADYYHHLIRKISTTGNVTTLAGTGSYGDTNGQGQAASFYNPTGIAVDSNGRVFVSDQSNNLIRTISPTGLVSTHIGTGSYGSIDGANWEATFSLPAGLCLDKAGNVIVADYNSHKIRKIMTGTSDDSVISLYASNYYENTSSTRSVNYLGALFMIFQLYFSW